MLPLEELEIYKQMQADGMCTESPLKSLLIESYRKDLALQERIEAPHWSIYLPFALVSKPQARLLFLWAGSRKVQHWMRALLEGRPLFEHPGRKSSQPQHAVYRKRWLENASSENDCQKILQQLQSRQLLVCGMGGSSIAAMALDQAIGRSEKAKNKICYLTTTDPSEIEEKVKNLGKEKTSLVLISKSGSTHEILRNFATIQALGVRFEQVIAITEKNSTLWNHRDVTMRLEMDPLIGGRFSSSSILGEFLLSFRYCQEVYSRFLQGAVSMDAHALEDRPWKNLPLALALVRQLHSAIRRQSAVCIAPYKECLAPFVQHIQQLEMESLGKKVDLLGRDLPSDLIIPVIFGGSGPQCQHTYFQWMHQGTQKVPVEFIAQLQTDDSSLDKDALSAIMGQMMALASGLPSPDEQKHTAGGRSSWLLATEKLTPESVGALLAIYEHSTAYQSFLLGVNAFDQEGVELGKRLSSHLFASWSNENSSEFWKSMELSALTPTLHSLEKL